MRVVTVECGRMACNNYLAINDQTNECVLIDCSGNETLLAAMREGVTIKAILLTHGHADHIEALDEVAEKCGCPIYIHAHDAEFLKKPNYNLSTRIYGTPLIINKSVGLLQDEMVVEEAGLTFEVIHTPGHTPGCVCYRCGNVLFTGDTLFFESIGAELPPFGNSKMEIASIRSRLFTILENCDCYPGHGERTALFYEMKNNLYCRK